MATLVFPDPALRAGGRGGRGVRDWWCPVAGLARRPRDRDRHFSPQRHHADQPLPTSRTARGHAFGPDLILQGSDERLAPILMTALATALALVPIVLGGICNSDGRQPRRTQTDVTRSDTGAVRRWTSARIIPLFDGDRPPAPHATGGRGLKRAVPRSGGSHGFNISCTHSLRWPVAHHHDPPCLSPTPLRRFGHGMLGATDPARLAEAVTTVARPGAGASRRRMGFGCGLSPAQDSPRPSRCHCNVSRGSPSCSPECGVKA